MELMELDGVKGVKGVRWSHIIIGGVISFVRTNLRILPVSGKRSDWKLTERAVRVSIFRPAEACIKSGRAVGWTALARTLCDGE